MKDGTVARWRRLQVQMTLWVILPLMTLLFTVVLLGINSHQQSMRGLVLERSSSLAELLAGNVSALLNIYTGRFRLIARRASPDNLETLRQELAEDNLSVKEIVVALQGKGGQILASVPDPFPFSSLPVSSSTVTVAPYGASSYLLWRVPALDGSLIVGLPLARVPIADLIRRQYPGRAGHVAIIERYGHLVTTTTAQPPPPFESWDHLRYLGIGAPNAFFHHTPQGEIVIAYATVPGTQWTLVLQESWSALVAPLPQLARFLPAILAATLAVSLLALYFGVRYVSTPLRDLAQIAERIGAGDFAAAQRPVGGVSEIEEVRHALNRMATQVREYQTTLRHYLHLLTNVQEEERARLAREIHDDTVQALIAIHQQVQLARRAVRRNPEQAEQRLQRLHTTTLQAVRNLRRLLQALRPVYLEELGLVAALETIAQEAGARIRVIGSPRRLPPNAELALFRIAQEALTNAQRHARASSIQVELRFEPQAVILVVEDDGIGFAVPSSPSALIRDGHLGLISMYERAQSVGGELRIESAAGQGTRVQVTLPHPPPNGVVHPPPFGP